MPRADDMVLLVEDEPFVALVAQQMLEDEGFGVLVASDGAKALDILATPSGHIAVAMVDLGLPDMRGDELVARIREQKPDLPIIIASGYSTRELEAIFNGQSRVGLIGKPYDTMGLKQAMRSVGVKMRDD